MEASTPGRAADGQGTTRDPLGCPCGVIVGAGPIPARSGRPSRLSRAIRIAARVMLNSGTINSFFFNGLWICSMEVSTPGGGARTRREHTGYAGRFARSVRRGGACPRPCWPSASVRCAKTGDHKGRPYEFITEIRRVADLFHVRSNAKIKEDHVVPLSGAALHVLERALGLLRSQGVVLANPASDDGVIPDSTVRRPGWTSARRCGAPASSSAAPSPWRSPRPGS